MTPISRRGFVALGAGIAAGAALPATRADAATTGTVKDVKHVVILMQENRSFDHYFGRLKGVRGFGDRSGITLSGGQPVFNQPNGLGRQYPWKLSSTPAAGGVDGETLAQCNGDLPHSWSSQHSAWNKGRLDHWVAGVGNVRSLGYLDRGDIPFHYALADNYTVCDAYFSSTLSATGPNRTYLWSGKVDSSSHDGGDESGLTWETYAEALQRAGVSWKVYQNANDNYGDNGLAYFSKIAGAEPGDPLHDRGMASVPAVTGSTPDDIAAAIKADALAGKLPQVSWVVANQAFSEHPYAPPGDGAHFVDLVHRALAASPEVFDSTVLFLNYDENDGFFDHVPPPSPPADTAGEFLDGTPFGLGFRVPMVVMSPWTRGGWVSSEVFDHTSVLRFMETWTTALGTPATCPNISAWRRKVTGDLTGVFDFTRPVYGMPSGLPATKVIGYDTCGPLPNPAPQTNALPRNPEPAPRAPSRTSRTATSTTSSSAPPARSSRGSPWRTRAPPRAAPPTSPSTRTPTATRRRGSTRSTPAARPRTSSTSARAPGRARTTSRWQGRTASCAASRAMPRRWARRSRSPPSTPWSPAPARWPSGSG